MVRTPIRRSPCRWLVALGLAAVGLLTLAAPAWAINVSVSPASSTVVIPVGGSIAVALTASDSAPPQDRQCDTCYPPQTCHVLGPTWQFSASGGGGVALSFSGSGASQTLNGTFTQAGSYSITVTATATYTNAPCNDTLTGSGTASVTVKAVGVAFNPSPIYVHASGDTRPVTATVTPADAADQVTFSTDNYEIATVTGSAPNLTIAGVTPGTATLSATVGSTTVQTATIYSFSVVFSPDPVLVAVNGTAPLEADIFPSQAQSQITFDTLDASIASFMNPTTPPNLTVRGGPTAGTTTLRAKFGTEICATVVAKNVAVKIQRRTDGGADYQDIGAANQDVLPGQRMDLKAVCSVTDMPITYQWTLATKTFKDYTANQTTATLTPLAAADLTAQTVLFYWADTGDGKQVRCTLTLGGKSFDATATLNVKQPTATCTTTLGFVDVRMVGGGQRLGLFADPMTSPTGGVSFTATVRVPAGFGEGRWNFVQTVNPGRRRTLTAGGVRQHWSLNGSVVLDTTYPYEPPPYTAHPGTAGSWATGAAAQSVTDSPSIALSAALTFASAFNEQFRIYIMFLPPGANSRYVPLQYLDWSWTGDATRAGAVWTLGAVSRASVDNAGHATSDHPIWTANVTSGMYVAD